MDSADLEQTRRDFAERVQREGGIRSTGLINGLSVVPRERFVGSGPWHVLRLSGTDREYQITPDDDPRHLYDTILVALDPERGLNNGEPISLLRFLDMLDLAPGSRFLHIGCGVGYYTAIAAQAVIPTGKVVAVEVDGALAERARRNLLPYKNVDVVYADGDQSIAATFDAIFINAGAIEIRSGWLDQLAEGGRLLIPLTVAFPTDGSAVFSQAGHGYTLLVTKSGDHYAARFVSPVAVFHCVGARDSASEQLLEEAFKREDRSDVRSLRRDQHNLNADCWLHAPTFCLSRLGI
jgi:protein-L-isoaspartate(D-aspartate) O-methyltransferase